MMSLPSAASAVAMPRPIPLVEPVTMAILPCNMKCVLLAEDLLPCRDAAQCDRFGEALDARGYGPGFERDEALGDAGLARHCRRQHDVAAGALALQPRREIDRAAEIVEPVVQRHGDAGAAVQPDLDQDRH